MPVQTEDFLNVQFKGFWGSNHVLHEFTLDGLPFMNPFDWISLFNIVAKDVKNYEPTYDHLKMIIKCYILDITTMDVEMAFVLKNRWILKPFD